MGQSANKSLFSELWERRLPQFFATYVGVCWGILQFLNFATNRYGLNDSYIDKFLIFATILIPAVLIFLYNHGKPGKDSWTKLEKILLPGNLLLATVMAFLVGNSNAVSAAPTAVEITTDEGEQITRMVPAQSQIRQLLLFPFKTNSKEDKWVKFGLPLLLSKDLQQDMRVSVRGAESLEYHYNSHEYEIDEDIPFSTELKIAQKTMQDYFITGEVNKVAENWNADIKAYETGSGEIFFEKSFSSADIYSMTDEITKAISSQMFLKENESEFSNYTDLPASDLITSNLEAFKTYLEAQHLLYYDEEYGQASQLFQKALSLDNKSPELNAMAAYGARSLGDLESSKKLISESLKHCKMLPERQQFKIKKDYYLFDDQVDNVLKLMNNWITLYPSDYDPHDDLLSIYHRTFQLSKAKDVGLLAIKNGHKNRVLKDMVDICISKKDFEEAESYLKDYHKAYPELAKDDYRLAEIFIEKGDLIQAKEIINEKLLNDPENSRLHRKLGELHYNNGEIDKSETAFSSALKYSIQGPDSAFIYQMQMIHYVGLGQKSKFEEYSDKWMMCMRTYMPEPAVVTRTMGLLGVYAMAGSEDYIKNYYKKVGQQMPQMNKVLDCVSNFILSLFKNDAIQFRKHYQGDCKELVLQGTPDLKYMAEGFLSSMESNHEDAITNFETYIEKSGVAGKEFGYLLSKEYRSLNQPEKGISLCKEFLKTAPNNATFLFELALAQTANKNLEDARATYAKLQELWNKIEPGFIYYEDYLALGIELGLG